MVDSEPIRERFSRLSPHLDERGRRIFAAVEANACGYGGMRRFPAPRVSLSARLAAA
jgi:hypothetical protein